MALSDGQLIFAAIFLALFIIGISFAYRSDLQRLKGYKTGALKVLLFIIVVMAIFYFVVKVLSS